jgi:transposase-like protein
MIRQQRLGPARLLRALAFAQRSALRAFKHALHEYEASPNPKARLLAELREARLHSAGLEQELRSLKARLARLLAGLGRNYTPAERAEICEHAAAFGLSCQAIAQRFLLCVETARRWMVRFRRGTSADAARLCRALPIRSHQDVIVRVVRSLQAHGMNASGEIARALAAVGIDLPVETVRRIRKRGAAPLAPVTRTGRGPSPRLAVETTSASWTSARSSPWPTS